ncbi:MAG: peptide ABC transporter substrate-binding protein, partial [Bdellovibrionales bacterium]|nr:peptide ABC transporter substrate-binding protein [Bdellovibrionales bacterium]
LAYLRAFRVFFVLGVAGLLCLSSACTKKKNSYDVDPAETFRTHMLSEPPSLDWSLSTDTTSSEIQTNIMEGLTDIDIWDPLLKLKPALATAWYSEDSKHWHFTLRKDVKWTDGIPFTAQHLVDGWERLLNPATASQYSYQLYSVKNAKAYNEGKITDFSKVGVRVTESGDLDIELEQPQAFFPQLLFHHSTYPIRKDVVEKYKEQWTEPEHIVTLGSYILKKWDHDKALLLERNPYYYGEAPKVKFILYYVINELSTAVNLFDAGEIDALHDLPTQTINELKKMPEFKMTPYLGIYYYGFNTKKKPTDNADVRRAISMAIDRKEITTLLAGGQLPTSGFIPQGMMGYDPTAGVKFDPDAARKLLDKAGYKDRSKFPTLSLGFNTLDQHQRIAENVQEQLKRNLGISTELSSEEWKTYLNTLRVNPPNIYRHGWVADYPDPDNFLNLFTSYSENNHTFWGNSEYDSLIEKAVSESDASKRIELYKQ